MWCRLFLWQVSWSIKDLVQLSDTSNEILRVLLLPSHKVDTSNEISRFSMSLYKKCDTSNGILILVLFCYTSNELLKVLVVPPHFCDMSNENLRFSTSCYWTFDTFLDSVNVSFRILFFSVCLKHIKHSKLCFKQSAWGKMTACTNKLMSCVWPRPHILISFTTKT